MTGRVDLDTLARVRRVRDRMDRAYAQPLNVQSLARDLHVSAGHLSRQFTLAYGESPYAYLMTRRIERAMTLLRTTDQSVTEICFAVGCQSLGTFSTRFSELVGVNLATDDLDATFAAIEAAGADIVQETIDQDYGIRDAAVRDPAGNLIRIQQNKKEA